VTIRLCFGAVLVGATAFLVLSGETPPAPSPGSSAPSAVPSSSVPRPLKPASFKERLAAAESVKVQTDILGFELDSSLAVVHARLDPLAAPGGRPKDATGDADRDEGEQRVFWKLGKTDYASVFVKADDRDRITYMIGLLRPGREIPFDQIGQVEKAPIKSEKLVAWDVVRQNGPLIRVVARGSEGKANSITLFIVKRQPAR
jgi:hypothetical protein